LRFQKIAHRPGFVEEHRETCSLTLLLFLVVVVVVVVAVAVAVAVVVAVDDDDVVVHICCSGDERSVGEKSA
jgi:hypothetical protein